jgi:hypothetical protein
MEFPHTTQIIYQSIITILQEFHLKRDLENKKKNRFHSIMLVII